MIVKGVAALSLQVRMCVSPRRDESPIGIRKMAMRMKRATRALSGDDIYEV